MVGYTNFLYQPKSMMASDFYDETTPTQILNIAIRKRRELYDQKEQDLFRELLNKSLIQNLCSQLGRGRSKKSRRSRSSSKRRRSNSGDEEHQQTKKLHLDEDNDPERLYIVEDQPDKGETSPNTSDFEIDPSTSPSMVQSSKSSSIDYEQMERFLDSDETHYNGYWSEKPAIVPNLAQDQLDEPKVNSQISQTLLQDSDLLLNDKANSLEIDVEDPLEMNLFFQQLYDSSYSIVESTKEFTGVPQSTSLVDTSWLDFETCAY